MFPRLGQMQNGEHARPDQGHRCWPGRSSESIAKSSRDDIIATTDPTSPVRFRYRMPTRSPDSVILLVVALSGLILQADWVKGQEPGRVATPPGAPTAEASNSPERVLVRDSEVLSAYGAPAEFSGSRFASLTNAYVLPPGVVYAGLIYQGDALRFSQPNHLFTQEVEVGLPYRINIAVENSIQSFAGYSQESTFSFEVRYALADWNKIPLNPTIFVEYKKGIGYILHDEGAAMRAPPGEPAIPPDKTRIPDAGEVRLLLAQEFPAQVEWALNLFFEQEVRGDRGREWGFAQSILRPVLLPREQPQIGCRNAVFQLHRQGFSKQSGAPFRDWSDRGLETNAAIAF